MIKVQLNFNNAYKWYNSNNAYVIGHLFYGDVLYKDEDFLEFVKQYSIEELKEIIIKSSGFFAIVIIEQNIVTLMSDIVRSFPVFYSINKNRILITDNVNQFKTLELESVDEILMSRYVTGDKTLYRKVKQLENAEILTININGEILKEKYFYFYNSNPDNFNIETEFKKFDIILINTFKKMIKYLDGRTAVIPLSGGHDSRMIAYYLKILKYPNIITYTYGNTDGSEANVSKQVANYLNLKWFFVPYKRKNMSKKYNNKKNFENISHYCGRGYSIPHIQEWEAIDYLLTKKIIDENCVIIPGHAMDFIAGSHISKDLLNNHTSLEKVKMVIYKNNYNLYKGDNSKFDSKLALKLNIQKFDNKKISNLAACNYFENWEFEERQSKFVANSVRIYDYYSLKWYLPYWDIQLVDFFKNIPIKIRYNRNFFTDFVNYKYKELMEAAPIFKYEKQKKQKGIKSVLNNFNTVINLYSNHFLNYYGYFKFSNYLYKVFKYKTLSYDYFIALDYIKYLKKTNKIPL